MPDFTTSDGLRLHYEDHGTGQPILCLSGLTRNARDFDYLAPHLTGARMIALDYRGRGKSDWADPATYDIRTEGRDALELLDHVGVERTAIIGTSRGGLIAMLLAATARERLTGICLNDIGPEIAPAGLEAIRGYVGRNPSARTHEEALAGRAALLPGFANVPESRWREEVMKHYEETPDGLVITYDPALTRTLEGDGAAPDLWPLFDATDGLPLACIRGANSDLLAPETVAAMLSRRPDMIFAEVPDRGHVPFLDEPEALRAIAEWRELL